MDIFTNVSIPTVVTIAGREVKANKKKDLLIGASIKEVTPVRASESSIYAKAIAIDSVTGERIAVMGFGENAQVVAQLTPGKEYNFSGAVRGFTNSQYGQTFSVHEVLADVIAGRA